MKKAANIMLICVAALTVFGISILCLALPKADYSESERRKLKAFPELSWQSVLQGKFMQDFEQYALDGFPFRDGFRRVKAFTSLYITGKLDNNGIYAQDGHICKQEYPLKSDSLQRAAKIFGDIYRNYLENKETSVYFSIVPDKNFFLAEKSGNLSMDYNELIEAMKSGTDFMKYIDIVPLLEADDYYKTDAHWRQERITDVANKLAHEMGARIDAEYETKQLNEPFYGVYCGQSALYRRAETLEYLTNSAIESSVVTDFENNRTCAVYNMEKAGGNDLYEIFLSGPLSLVTIENPLADEKKELVIFRDSFASSLAPLLIDGYSKITLVDIRYISSGAVCKMIDFEKCDVLFLFSTLVLNNSESFKS